MDKREYQEKLQEINRLIADGDYEGAAGIADSIDWKRVRNVQTLVMISEVYEALERYEDSKALLLRAYRRSPTGRTVLYRLVECCIKLRQFDQAIEYYSEYVQAAPHDNNKYILKYKIYRGRGSSLDEQIDILKEYLDQEYNEKWAYELARLQIQADRVQEGIATCDDLVLWFHSGKYVIKALELKKKYAPLTPKQQEIYDNRFDEEEEEQELRPESYLSEAASLAKAERAAAAQEEIKSELAADISHTAQMEATKAELTRKAEEVHAEVDRKAAESMKALAEPELAEEPEEAGAAAEVAGAEEIMSAGVVPEAAAETAAVGIAAVGAVSEEVAGTTVAGAETFVGEAAETASERAVEMAETAEETAGTVENAFSGAVSEAPAETAEIAAAVADAFSEPAAETVLAETERFADETVPTGADTFEEEISTAAAVQAAEMPETVSTGVDTFAEEASAAVGAFETASSAGVDTFAEELTTESGEHPEEETETAEEEDAGTAENASAGAVSEASDGKAGIASAAAAVAAGIAVMGAVSAASEVTESDAAGTEGSVEKAAPAMDTLFGAPAEEATPQQMQEDMIRSMREIVSGVGPREQLEADEAALEEAIDRSKEDQENAVAARGTDMTFRVPESEASQKRQAGRLTIDDILLAMGDRGDHVRQVTGGSVMSATEEAQMTAQHQAEAKAASYDGMGAAPGYPEPNAQSASAAAIGGEDVSSGSMPENPEIPLFLRDGVREAKNTSEIPASDIAQADDALRADMGLAGRDEAAGFVTGAPEQETAAAPAETEGGNDMTDAEADPAAAVAAAFMSTPRVPYTKEIAEAKTRRLPVDEIRKLHEAYLTESAAAAEEASINASRAAEKAAEMAEEEVTSKGGAFYGEDGVSIAQAPGRALAEASGAAPMQQGAFGGDAFIQPDEFRRDTAAQEGSGNGPFPAEPSSDGRSAVGPVAAAAAAAGFGAAAGAAGQIGEQVTREVPKSEPEPQVFTGRQYLKENQMELFRGFTTIDTLPEQIAGAIWQAENRKDDRTSRTGNILILGAHGCGKTTIATGIAKAIAEDKGTHSVKMAKIYAADLNRKDIAATIAKIAGGVLIVEEAGDLDDAIVDQLTTAMEFRTDGMIMILEDEQRYIHDLLMRHPRFTMKFTAQIYIPEYTSDDLVNFGQIYAGSKDYVFSEKAVEACRARVEAAMKSGEPVSVTNVIELVDRAIKNANTFFRRIGSAKKRYDSEDRIILREKDFR